MVVPRTLISLFLIVSLEFKKKGGKRMQISCVEVKNFRALKSASIDFGSVTSLLGENNSGKSAFLKAVDLFFSGSPKVTERDFHAGDYSEDIEVTLKFHRLTPHEQELFQSNLIDDGLTVTRTLSLRDGGEHGRFSVDTHANPAFAECRNESGKTPKREKYRELQKEFELPNVKNADEIEGKLAEWEAANPEALKRVRGAFRGFQNVAAGQLKAKTDFILVEAVKDAHSDIGQGQKSPIIDILNTITRQTIENNREFQSFVEDANRQLAELTSPDRFGVLAEIGGALTSILQNYYKDSELITTWDPVTEMPVSFPSPKVDVRNHNFTTGIDRVGHGLQRAVILTVLEYVAKHRMEIEGDAEAFVEPQSDIILGIEEPEIYQHPTKQRLFRQVLRNLADGFSVATGIRMQVIYVTHSPLFVDLPTCSDIRVIRRISEDGGQQNVAVSKVTLGQCSGLLAGYLGKDPMGDAAFAAKLHTFTPEIAEGFFCQAVVLVEGVSDKALLEGVFRQRGRDPLAEGIVIANVEGKNKLDKPALIFRELGIPAYVIFDNDQKPEKKKSKDPVSMNRLLQKVCGVDDGECTDWPSGVFGSFAAWDGTVEKYIQQVVGEEIYEKVRDDVGTEYELVGADCVKSPAVAADMLSRFVGEGHKFDDLDDIVVAIDNLLS